MWENDVPHFKKTKSTTVIGKALAKSWKGFYNKENTRLYWPPFICKGQNGGNMCQVVFGYFLIHNWPLF